MTDSQAHLVFVALADPTRRLLFQQLCEEVSGQRQALPVDVLSLLQQVQAHPATYGFLHTNAVDNCQANNCNSLPLVQQNTYIFNDILHLTNGFDQVLANDAAGIINAGITILPCGG